MLFLAFAAFCTLLCGEAIANSTSCADVREVFVMKGIGQANIVPETMTKGDKLEVCPSSQTCCSKQMETQYQEAVKKDFRQILQGAGSYLKTLITTSSTKFRDTFLNMIQVTENSTYALFSDVYQSLDATARVPLGQFFADLLAYMSGQDVDLEDRVDAFFDSLFPLAFHHSVNVNQKPFSDVYKVCLKDVQKEVRPFGDLSEKMSFQITKSFEAARTFLEALQLGVEVINTTEHMDFGQECRKALVRLTYCPHCQGHVRAKPCAGLCINVMRGCLSSVSELDSSWSEYVSALERLTSGMVGVYNIEQVLSSLDTKISDVITYMMDNTAEISKRVKQKCGPMRRVTREATAPSSTPSFTRAPPAEASMYMMLQNFMQKVAESKDFYANLADNLCNDGNLVIKGELRCWNGKSLAEYTETIAGVGVSAQKYNPEMKPPRFRDITINTLADKLQHVKQILSSRVTYVPQSDSSVMGEGSGSGYRWKSDDEDYAEGSGSGDFHKDDKTDIHFVHSDGSSEGSSKPSSSQTLILHIMVKAVSIICTMFFLVRL